MSETRLPLPSGQIRDVIFLPGTRRLAVASSGSIQLWDVEVSQELISLGAGTDTITHLAVTPDAHTLISHHDSGVVRVWRSQKVEQN